MAVPVATAPQAVDHLQTVLAYQFANPMYLVEALGAAGSGYNINPNTVAIDGNKRLAQLGDAIMKVVVLDDWYASATERGTSIRKRNPSVLTESKLLPNNMLPGSAHTRPSVHVDEASVLRHASAPILVRNSIHRRQPLLRGHCRH
jgi:hypothetical protein